jgi:hypothetical protein
MVNSITQATSPLKVYEYLNMLKPVVAPDLRPLHGLPGVLLAQDRQDFIAKVGVASQQKLSADEIEAFTAQNNWQARGQQPTRTGRSCLASRSLMKPRLVHLPLQPDFPGSQGGERSPHARSGRLPG